LSGYELLDHVAYHTGASNNDTNIRGGKGLVSIGPAVPRQHKLSVLFRYQLSGLNPGAAAHAYVWILYRFKIHGVGVNEQEVGATAESWVYMGL
jgi:hypothetical protein